MSGSVLTTVRPVLPVHDPDAAITVPASIHAEDSIRLKFPVLGEIMQAALVELVVDVSLPLLSVICAVVFPAMMLFAATRLGTTELISSPRPALP